MIFIDTGAFLARHVAADQFHKKSLKIWKRLEQMPDALFTSVHVLNETLTLLGRRAGYDFAAARGRSITSSQRLTLLRSDASDERHALELFEKYADHQISFTDALSFALMHRHRIDKVFTFDRHFVFAGFKTIS